MQEAKYDKLPELAVMLPSVGRPSPRKQSMGERLTEGLQKRQDKEQSALQAAPAFLHRKR